MAVGRDCAVGDRLTMSPEYKERLRMYTGGATFEEVRLLAVSADRIRLAVVTSRTEFLPLDLWLRDNPDRLVGGGYCGFGSMTWLVFAYPLRNAAMLFEQSFPVWLE